MITFTLPMKLESLANKREHHFAKSRRAKEQRGLGKDATKNSLTEAFKNEDFPYHITITRIGKRKLDSDNLAISAKNLRDGIADGLQIDDGNDCHATWHYEQEKGKDYAVKVEIRAGE